MEFIDFLREMLVITEDFAITRIDKDETNRIIRIHLKYLLRDYQGKKIYDLAP
ncbi:MAG: hypothetical protein IT283_01280, partial [Bacteroidetes bacterium]|nr:hypothetical protein [Bacteroidota bacterium]